MDESNIFEELCSCEICHQAPADRSENPDSRLCKKCREQAVRYPIPWFFYPIAFIVLLLTVFAYFRMPKSLSDYRIYASAETQIEDGMLYDTLAQLMDVVERHPNSTDLAARLVTLSMDYGCYDFAAYCMNTYLAGRSLSDTTYGNMLHYQSVLNRYYDTLDELDSLSEQLGEDTPQELGAVIIKEKLEDMKDDPKMFPSVVWYYLSMMADDPQESMTYLENCLDENPMNFAARTQLGTLYRRSGDLDTARTHYEQVLRYEKTEAQACRCMAVLALLENRMDEALSYARTAYESDPDADYVRETYLIALSFHQNKEEMNRLRQELSDAGTPVEEDTEALLQGETTLQEYYIE